MTLSQAETEISNKVYEACLLFERLEHVKKVRGNGHHMMQKVAAFAVDLLRIRWEEEQ